VTSAGMRASSAGPPHTSTGCVSACISRRSRDSCGLLQFHEVDDRAEVIPRCRLPVGWTPEKTRHHRHSQFSSLSVVRCAVVCHGGISRASREPGCPANEWPGRQLTPRADPEAGRKARSRANHQAQEHRLREAMPIRGERRHEPRCQPPNAPPSPAQMPGCAATSAARGGRSRNPNVVAPLGSRQRIAPRAVASGGDSPRRSAAQESGASDRSGL